MNSSICYEFKMFYIYFSSLIIFDIFLINILNQYLFSKKMAPKVGLEPTTNRLTAGCSTTELLRNSNIYIHLLVKVHLILYLGSYKKSSVFIEKI